ncbi:cell division protein ZapC, partial [Serratia bockelmannii]|nr:cell division protein ZapC [Serratia bockelmannii]
TVAGRTMVLGDAIKVMHDRLKPCAQDESAAPAYDRAV